MIKELIKAMNDPLMKLPDDEASYYRIIEQIESDGISPQVYLMLKDNNIVDSTPLFFQERLTEKYYAVLYQNIFIKNRTEKILNNLDAEGIEAIPLKGVYFSENYFGHIGARATSDIDILVRENRVSRAIKVVERLGFNKKEEFIPGHFHQSFSKKMPGNSLPLTVEIHWDIVKEATSRFSIDLFWRDAVCMEGYEHIKRLSDNHTFYMICLHAWRHNLDSLKHYIDIIQLIHVLGDKLDYNMLFNNAQTHQTFKRVKRTLLKVYNEFPTLEAKKQLPPYLQAKGNSKRHEDIHPYINFISYQFLSYDSVVHIFKELINWLFPNKVEVKNEIGKECSYFISLVHLYKKRCSGVRKTSHHVSIKRSEYH